MDDIILKCLVIKSIPKGEADSYLTLVSEEGKINATIKGVKKANARLSYAAQPFCFGEYVFSKRGANYVVTNCTEIENFYNLANNYIRQLVGYAMLDILNQISVEQDALVFLLTLKSLAALTYEEVNEKQLLGYYILKLLEVLGVKFQANTHCADCNSDFQGVYYYDPNFNGIVCPMCISPLSVKVTNTTYQSFKMLGNVKIDKLNTIKLQSEFLSPVLQILSQALENTLDVKSKVLQTVINS